MRRAVGILAAAGIVVTAATTGPGMRADGDEAAVDSGLVHAIRASIGALPPGYVVEDPVPARATLQWVRGVDLFTGRVLGPHAVWVVGMAARLPDNTVLPLGCPVTRRMLVGYVTFDSGLPDDSLISYAIELAQLDGAIPFEPVVFTHSDDPRFADISPDILADAVPPSAEPPVDKNGRVAPFRHVRFYVKASLETLRLADVAVMTGTDRFHDFVWATSDLP